MGISGATLFFFQTTLYSRINSYLGSKRTFQISNALLMPMFVLFSYSGQLQRFEDAPRMALLTLLYSVRLCVYFQGLMSIFAIVSNSVKKSERGTLNGLAQSAISLTRFMGPTLSGYLFSWSQTQVGFFDFHFPFYLLSIMAFAALFISKSLSKSQNKPQ